MILIRSLTQSGSKQAIVLALPVIAPFWATVLGGNRNGGRNGNGSGNEEYILL